MSNKKVLIKAAKKRNFELKIFILRNPFGIYALDFYSLK